MESKMGTVLPADYKWLIDRYGQGIFGDFLHVFHPESGHKALELEYQHERTAWALGYLLDRGHELPRMPSELLSFGRSDNGDVSYWIKDPVDDPDRWRVAVGEARGPIWEEFDGGAVEWLESVLSKKIRMRTFPGDFPRKRVIFKSIHDRRR
ncbi:SMI1/KNR4 family protein [Micromonospora sp. SH-82]|uniref:SMI1/KNR4 family protein n=1 Tax=Micromonospora sp. SH-82 TaxID=3132938 RepID=UPI003EB83E61